MNVKRYTANTLAEAMEEIKKDWGGDALILSQRAIKKGLFKKQYEVVAAYEEPDPEPKTKKPASKPTPPPSKKNASKGRQAKAPPKANPKASAYAKTKRSVKESPKPTPGITPPGEPDLPASAAAERALEILGHIGVQAGERPPGAAIRSADAAVTLPNDAGGDFQPLGAPSIQPEEHIVGRPASPSPSGSGEKEQKIVELQDKIDTLASSVNSLMGKMQLGHETRSYSPQIDAMMLSLLENEAHEEFVARIAREVDEIVTKQQEDPREVMEQLLRQYIGSADPIRLKRFKRTVVLLAGPTGVGKTTTLAKLAAIYSINHHAKVGVITTDTYRIAAVEQLKTYTEIMEIPLSIVYTPAEVADALRDHEDKDVVFIDTAGKSPSDRTHEEELTELIRHSGCDEVHLVMSATTGFTGMLNILNAYSFLTDFKVIMTKLDETPAWGGILNVRFLTDKPLSYTALGQNVPDDIEVADIRKIVARLIG